MATIINREAFAKALKVCVPVSTKSTKCPSMLLSVRRDSATLQATNDTVSVSYRLNAESTFTGDVLLSPRVLRALQAEHGEEVLLTPNEKTIVVRIDSDQWEFGTSDPQEFPPFEWSSGCDASMSAEEFSRALKFVEHAIEKDGSNTRYAMGGVCLEFAWLKGCTVQATDGRRMAFTSVEMVDELGEKREGKRVAIIPAATIPALKTLCGMADRIEVVEVGEQVQFSAGRLTLISKLLEGRFPNIRAQEQKGKPFAWLIAGQLRDAVQAAAVCADSNDPGMDLFFESADGIASVYARCTSEIGKSSGYGVCENVEDKRSLSLKPEFVLEALKQIPEESAIELRANESGTMQINSECGIAVIAGMTKNEP